MTPLKKANRCELRYLLSSIRRAVLDDRLVLTFPKVKFKYSEILSLFCAEGLIESFEERGNYLVIRLKYTYWKTWGKPISALVDIGPMKRVRRKDTIVWRDLAKKQHLEGDGILHVISTDRGIISSRSAVKKHLGGIPLIKAF